MYIRFMFMILVWLTCGTQWVRRMTWCFVPHTRTRIAKLSRHCFHLLDLNFNHFVWIAIPLPGVPPCPRIEGLRRCRNEWKPFRNQEEILVEIYGKNTTGECATEKLNRTTWAKKPRDQNTKKYYIASLKRTAAAVISRYPALMDCHNVMKSTNCSKMP